MIGMLALIASQAPAESGLGQARPPRPLDTGAIVSNHDYPVQALRAGDAGIVSMLLLVSEEGRVTECHVTERSGSRALDQTSCTLNKRRGRYEPARDADGNAVPGEVRVAMAWGLDPKWPQAHANLPLKVTKVPADYRNPVTVQLLFDASGKVSACTVTATSGSGVADAAACAYHRQNLTTPPVQGGSKTVPAMAVRYVTAALTPDGEAPAAE